MKNKIFAFLIILLCVLFSTPIFTFAEGTTVELETTQGINALNPGDTLTIYVTAKNVTNLVGGELILIYDPIHMSLKTKALENSTIIDFTTLNNVSNDKLTDEPGMVKLIFGLDKSTSPLSGEHVVATLTFNILSKGSGSLSIDSASTLISEDSNGALEKIVFNTNQLNYTILNKKIAGDVNGDEKITLEDLVYVANYYGLSNDNPEWNDNASIADIDKNGKINVLDLIFISRKLEL